ncbi:hypothetical protein BJX65DRAFT_313250 [Aspergillus insuetus]
MQNANSPRQWQPDDVDGHGSAHSYPSQHSLRSLEVHQPLAPPTSYQLPALSTSTAGRLHPAFPLSSDNINARALWADWIATEQYTSHEMVPQPTTAASSTSDASPRDSSDHRNQFTSEAVTGRYSATPLERSMQEREALGPGWVPFPPPVGQCTSYVPFPFLHPSYYHCTRSADRKSIQISL